MPFKVGSDYYFEAVQFVKDATRDLQENRLALCPTCAAKYRHALGTSLDDLRDDLLTQVVDASSQCGGGGKPGRRGPRDPIRREARHRPSGSARRDGGAACG